MTELTDEQKRFLVVENACFRKPSAVAKAFKERFEIEISRQLVECYDPNKAAGESLSVELRELFEKARKAYRESTDDIEFYDMVPRIRARSEMAAEAKAAGAKMIANALLDAIAKEVGGDFTNERKLKHSGPNGEPLPAERTVIILPDNGRGDATATAQPDRSAAGPADRVPGKPS